MYTVSLRNAESDERQDSNRDERKGDLHVEVRSTRDWKRNYETSLVRIGASCHKREGNHSSIVD